VASERDDEARLQNAIAHAIARVTDADAEIAANALAMLADDPASPTYSRMLIALAAAVRQPVIWAAIANARQAYELERRPVVARALSPRTQVAVVRLLNDVRKPLGGRDKGDELARRSRVTPEVRR
jgi:hypothetical protein